jgi:hypothetical protein
MSSLTSDLMVGVLVKQEQQRRQIWNLCGEHVSSFERGPMCWLTQHTATEDSHWLKKNSAPVAPFPALEYFLPLMALLLSEPTLFISKSREMMTSWLVCGYIAWLTQWLPQILCIIQTEKEDKAVQLIEYCRILYRRQPEWMQDKNKLTVDNAVELKRRNGSHVLAVPQGENQVRLYHPHLYMQDESAFLPEAEQCFNAVRPVAKQIVCVSSDEVGWFHLQTRR